MSSTGFWKPGESKPKLREKDSSAPSASGGSSSKKANDILNRVTKSLREKRAAKTGKDGKAKKGERYSSLKQRAKLDNQHGKAEIKSESSSVGDAKTISKAAVSGPSQGLLAMKFMQRKAKVEEARRENVEKRKKLESDFSSSLAKRLCAAVGDSDNRLVCAPDQQDPTLMIVGRRSFGGFNAVAQAAYSACIRDIYGGTALKFVDVDAGGKDEEDGISDNEMAERLGKVKTERP